ncbi:tRNA dimethylallyltransferase [Heyndrickxia shackletonii]|uniref:tRNA dimethylallyltransferase n=1 Tax=Heyndrickxia shackletonii TaxID=157838 RepID=A0A0Q3WTG4_9BACI|nr:tRNA (adenosine(37)-N6)-dimethylallyltransferase MiaA [Heyndrickxia shackletonii]KQL54549.1 tRNA dimethylallyltransferase [Heyndrickxia shackletonii]MBB2483284.1 tRNA (adenosine(37)-N6)-dimethylallyltransferase MiaA [Bacillus sp. APMAM]NEZ02449.1 tRNA (adenosine(37)-N6)-dimethylallyltransferase MiaA [Heyndrickxia shackletonii]RTZ53300.1 tRNA (adenosine(37)-N6)-dimethylallyltransferase MiaA [Bacillus sp. SAJ1]
MNDLQKLIVLIGPTAVGKTDLSIYLAQRFNGEIISGDSMQIYKSMDIGTAKISKDEMAGIPHHLIDIKNPDEPFSVAEFQKLVREKITEIHNRNRVPMIVGGTGLYIQSVLYDYRFSDDVGNDEIRTKLEQRVKTDGNMVLYEELKSIDPKSAVKIHPNNIRRVIRALEIFYCTGKTASDYQKQQVPNLLYNVALVGLTMDREQLYNRINKRVDIMMENGLLEEVKRLYDSNLREVQSIQAIGYKELYAYFDGIITLEEAIERLKQNSRNYAKRQLTWFRNKLDVTWFDMTDNSERAKKIVEISNFIAGKLHVKIE